jgi:dipeptide/tripeptide permease
LIGKDAELSPAMVPVVIVPFILDQCSPTIDYISITASGERVLVKRQLTEEKVAYLTNGLVDAGSFLSIATTVFEKRVGYWLAWLVPFALRLVLLLSILLLSPRLVRNKPEKNGTSKIFAVLQMLIRQTGWRFLVHDDAWETIKPSRLSNASSGVVNWEDADVDALRRFYHACKVFCILPPYFLVGPMIGPLLPAQGSSMTTNGTPNDILDNITSATVIIVSYALPLWVYPFLRHRGIRVQPILLITIGCALMIVAAVIGGILQLHIYHTSPCGYHATGCTKGTGVSPLSIWAQTPIYVLQSISIIFTISSSLSVACHFAPKNMMSVSISAMISVYIIKDAAGLGLAQAVSDPYLVWMWFGPALVMSVFTAIFYWNFHPLDNEFSRTAQDG